MERRDDTTSSGLYGEGNRGAGGKLRKLSARKPPTTPYDRPLAAKQTGNLKEGGGGWLSKFVDPAYRLISGGSARILPSFFSKSPITDAIPSSDSEDHDSDQGTSDDDAKGNSKLGISPSSEVTNPTRAKDGSSRFKDDIDEHLQDQKGPLSDNNGLSEIEQLLKGNKFSRDQINRLTEILHSKSLGLSNVDQGKKNQSTTSEGEVVGVLAAHETPRKSTEEKPESSNRVLWTTSTPLPPPSLSKVSSIPDAVGASPVDIARAYMGSRTSEMGLNSRSLILKDERAMPSANEFVSKSAIPLPSPKSSICWPGATVQDQRGYMTPQNPRGKFGLHNFPRTPYSRTIYSKFKSKLTQLQSDSNRCLETSSTPLMQLKTSIYGQVRSRGNGLDDGFGSVGPIRRIRHKVAETPSRGFNSLHSSLNNPSQAEKSSFYAGFSPAFKNLEPGVTGSSSKFQSAEVKSHAYEVSGPSVHPQTSQIARKILEHIDRKTPTLAEKSAELKLARTSKKPSSPEVTTAMLKENSSLPTVERLESHKNMNTFSQSFSAQGNEYGTSSLFKIQPQKGSAHEANGEGKPNTSASNLNFGSPSGIAGTSFGFSQNRDSQGQNMHENSFAGFNFGGQKEKSELRPLHNGINGQGVSKFVPNVANGSDVLNLPKRRSHSSSNKPALASISIGKPVLSTASLNNFGFTFPVSASSGVLSEPPTPSIMPSSSAPSASGLHQPNQEGASVPTYTFGSERSAPALVFSFPSTSSASASAHDETSEINFTFGSDKKRVSFSSVGKDAICY